jgi:methyl-accepting chemotaxis protein
MITSIAAAADEQSSAGESIAQGVTGIRDQSERVAESTRTTSTLAGELTSQYDALKSQVTRFKV